MLEAVAGTGGTARPVQTRAAAAALSPSPHLPASSPAPRPAEPRREADRRQATVLFADVSGFTSLSERLDPEEVRAFQDALFEMLADCIARHDGYVGKFLGDAVLALFGAPVAHEDDPERALSAALDMAAGAEALGGAWGSRLGQAVTLHIAVHTGPVVAGSLGGGAAGAVYDVTGDTVNTASRLLGSAEAGTILVSEATAMLCRHRFAFAPAGEVSLRGKARPIAIHRLEGALAEPVSARGLSAHGLVTPMVGRNDEIAALVSAFDTMREGKARLVTVTGEAGTGKTRLLAEFLAVLERSGRLDGVAVRKAVCAPRGEPTYGVFATLFREGYRVEAEDSLDVARSKLAEGLAGLGAPPGLAEIVAPVLGYLLGIEEARPRPLDPEQLKRQILLAARSLVERRLGQGPLLFVVEDAHAADAASLDLLADVGDALFDRPLMLVVTRRPDGRPLEVFRAEASEIRLAPLTAEDTGALLTGLFDCGEEDAFARVRRLIAERAGGNPLFVEEIVRSLVAEGVLVREGGRWTCRGGTEAVAVPPTLEGLLLSRIDRLPGPARRLLQEAAVLGLAFDEALLFAVASEPADAEAALDQLAAAELLSRSDADGGPARCRFSHALVHEVAYRNLLVARRAELHERAGRVLERAVGTRPERLVDLEALGHHWSLSRDKARGARYLATAGDRARAVYANDDAVRHYERALATLADCVGAGGEVLTIRERLGDVLAPIGRRGEALGHFEAVLAELDAAGDRAGAARLLAKIGGLHWEAGAREKARDAFAAGLGRLGENGRGIERAQLYEEMGRLAFRDGDNLAAIDWAEKALAETEGGPEAETDPERRRRAAATRVHASNTLGIAFARTGRMLEAVEQIERSVHIAEEHELLQAACRGWANLSVLYASLDPRRSIETCEKGLAAAKRIGDLGFQSRLFANLAVAYCALTDRCEGEGVAAAEAAADLDRRLGLVDHLAVPLIVLGQIHQCHGDHALALDCYREALGLAEEAGEPQLLFPCYDGLATLHLDAGDQATAEEYFIKAEETCRRAGLEPDALMVLPFLA